jgi:hypothetical protein
MRFIGIAMGLLFGLVACASDVREEDVPVVPPPAPEPGIVVPHTDQPRLRTTSLIVKNQYEDLTIRGIFLSPSDTDKWGPNQLSAPLLPGQRLTLEQIPCDDSYDLKVVESPSVDIVVVNSLFLSCGFEKIVTLGL